MPISKAKLWKIQKEKELFAKYSHNSVSIPKFNRKRELSPNTMANRQALKKEMEIRGIKPKKSSTTKQGTSDY